MNLRVLLCIPVAVLEGADRQAAGISAPILLLSGIATSPLMPRPASDDGMTVKA